MTIKLYARRFDSEDAAKMALAKASEVSWEGKVGFEPYEDDAGWIVATVGFDAFDHMVAGGEPVKLDEENAEALKGYRIVKWAHSDIVRAAEKEQKRLNTEPRDEE